jgi:hypothetical protein
MFLVGLGAIFVVSELDWQLGIRNEGRGGTNISTLESPTLGLLTLIIGIIFAMALSRFEARREAVVNAMDQRPCTHKPMRLTAQYFCKNSSQATKANKR